MELNFSNNEFKKMGMATKEYSKSIHSKADAFMLLIKNVKKEDLSYLCFKIQNKFKKLNIDLSIDECYQITQGDLNIISNKNVPSNIGEYLLDLAYECIEVDERRLGDNIIPNTTINTSAWLSHSLYAAKAIKEMASIMKLDPEKAEVLGILHDYGRKFTHNFSHVTRGYEELMKEGFWDEARAALTHSFINGERYANCDPADEGFFINDEGKPDWKEGAKKDDVMQVLEKINYDYYDMILNISDLIATDRGITSPYERVRDIATRKEPDKRNRGYFLSEFTNMLIHMMKIVTNDYERQRINPNMNLEEINSIFKEVSDDFYNMFFEKDKHIETSDEKNI